MNIWEIPFAAVTVCPIAGFMPLNANYNQSEVSMEYPLNNFTESLETRITNAKWRNSPMNSSNLFTEIATEEGYCYTFNMMSFDDLFEDNV